MAGPNEAAARPAYPVADPDPFYRAPEDLDRYSPGDVVRFRPTDASIYAGASGWNIAFRSTNSHGEPILAVTTLLLPPGARAGIPVLSYQPIVNALGARCAPSRALFNLEQAEAPGYLLPLDRGWALNLPDHTGQHGAYGAGPLAGMITLDSIRALRQLPELGLTDSRVGLAGYSGGGMATAWAAAMAGEYAPDLDIAGAVQGGVPADLEAMAEIIGQQHHPGFGLAFAAAIGLEREYPDRFEMEKELNHHGLWLRDFLSNECRRSILFHGAFRSANDLTNSPDWFHSEAARSVMRENSLVHFDGIPTMPVHMWHGRLDPLTPYEPVAQVARRYCDAGATLHFVTHEVAEHMIPAAAGFVEALDYLDARFRGVPAPTSCR
ncbi:lipase family protein [Hoyosella sp. YIM 151337]|uniref:lipase family protein n=1 Tax=Hoyosella sp. YIM 151337 TaxID=2992742 RepID=UPI00223598C4|nr:lipase family protein [Hoyosella sp. YIM 151337]MCW4354225.1 lipase family protein [Hoyosella sp. YIM 151337]